MTSAISQTDAPVTPKSLSGSHSSSLATVPSCSVRRKRKRVVFGAIGLIVLIFFWPTRFTISTVGIVSLSDAAVIEPVTSGIFAEWYVERGAWVKEGDPVCRMHSPWVEANFQSAEAELGLAKMQLSQIEHTPQYHNRITYAQLRLQQALVELEQAREQLNQLIIRAPISGRIFAHRWQDMMGLFVGPGSPLAQISNEASRVLEIPLTEAQVGLLEPNAVVYGQWVGNASTFKTHIVMIPQRKSDNSAYKPAFISNFDGPVPQQNLQGMSRAEAEAALYPVYIAEATLPDDEFYLQEQMRARLTIEGKWTILGLQLFRELRVLIF